MLFLVTQDFAVFALAAGKNAEQMAELCIAHQPKFAVMADQQAANALSNLLAKSSCNTGASRC